MAGWSAADDWTPTTTVVVATEPECGDMIGTACSGMGLVGLLHIALWGAILRGADGQGPGCMDALASNYDDTATTDDGSCFDAGEPHRASPPAIRGRDLRCRRC